MWSKLFFKCPCENFCFWKISFSWNHFCILSKMCCFENFKNFLFVLCILYKQFLICGPILTFFNGVAKIAFYKSLETFLCITSFFVQKNQCFPSFSESEQKIFGFLSEFVPRGSRSCLLRVQRNILRRRLFFEKKLFTLSGHWTKLFALSGK